MNRIVFLLIVSIGTALAADPPKDEDAAQVKRFIDTFEILNRTRLTR